MENIVYFLGAGFSAPIGIPVMSDFYIKSKDVYYSDKEKYKNFEAVFQDVSSLDKIKTYYKSDLLNIEEILSIFEMWEYLSGGKKADQFRKYIADVITYYTPGISTSKINKNTSNWYDFIWGMKEWTGYGWFAANLLNLRFDTKPRFKDDSTLYLAYDQNNNAKVKYSIITLNYDLIFENILNYIDEDWANITLHKSSDMEFTDAKNTKLERYQTAKIHGSIDKHETIILPTWRKGANSDDDALAEWMKAFELLANANQIRILGYSFPDSDYYVRYLFKSAIIRSKHLRKIDVICLDPKGIVKKGYDEFINFKYSQFNNADIGDYLENIVKEEKENIRVNIHTKENIEVCKLEQVHKNFMDSIT